jgi:hypothetical protein
MSRIAPLPTPIAPNRSCENWTVCTEETKCGAPLNKPCPSRIQMAWARLRLVPKAESVTALPNREQKRTARRPCFSAADAQRSDVRNWERKKQEPGNRASQDYRNGEERRKTRTDNPSPKSYSCLAATAFAFTDTKILPRCRK